jgi:simple sugar transport system permease protein
MIFGKWQPFGALPAANFFGLTLSIKYKMQTCGEHSDARLVGMLPYLVTLFVLAGFVGRSIPPAADGVPY